MKYSAYAECEIIYCVNCEISYSVRCEMKFDLHICEANISQRSYFTWQSQISLAAGFFLEHIDKKDATYFLCVCIKNFKILAEKRNNSVFIIVYKET